MRPVLGAMLLLILFLSPVAGHAYTSDLDQQAVREAIAYGVSRKDRTLVDSGSPHFVRLVDSAAGMMTGRPIGTGLALILTPYMQVARTAQTTAKTDAEILAAARDLSGVVILIAQVASNVQGLWTSFEMKLHQGTVTVPGYRVSGNRIKSTMCTVPPPPGQLPFAQVPCDLAELVSGFIDDDLDSSGAATLRIAWPSGFALGGTINLAQLR